MKKILMMMLLGLGVTVGVAQTQNEFRWGVTGGLNVPKLTDVQADCRLGFNLGVRAQYGLFDHVYASSGALLSVKGFEYGDSNNLRGNPLYLEIPIQVGYSYQLGDAISLFGETGPYFAFGLSGKIKQNGVDIVPSDKIDYFGGDAANRFDLGWGFRLGLEVRHIQIHMGYEYGFMKVFDSYFSDASNHNSNFTVGVSYFF